MCMVNCSVYDRVENKTIFPWKILCIDQPGSTVEQFFDESVSQKIENAPKELELESVFLGKSKDSLDRIEVSLVLEEAVSSFGHFLKYHVRLSD